MEFSFVGSLGMKPWLVGVPDPYDTQSPYHRWTVRFSASRLDRALGAPGEFKRLKVLQRGVSPRVVRAQVLGTRGARTATGPQAVLGARPARHLVHGLPRRELGEPGGSREPARLEPRPRARSGVAAASARAGAGRAIPAGAR